MAGLDSFDAALREMIREIVRDEVRAALADVQRPTEYLPLDEAAKRAAVHVDTVRRWIREGKLSRHGAGRHARVVRADFEALLAGASPTVAVPPRAESGGRFARGERLERPRTRRDPDDLSPEEMARRDFGR